MNNMGLFSKKIKLKEEGRELEIIDDTKNIDETWLKKIIGGIEKFYISEPKFENLSYLKIRFTSELEPITELMLPLFIKQIYANKGFDSKIKNGVIEISLGLPYKMWQYEKKNGKDITHTIIDFLCMTIFHEFCHLWHHDVSKNIRIARKRYESLFEQDKLLNKKLKKKFKSSMINIADIRHLLFILFIKFLEEGIAMFIELERDNKIKFDKGGYDYYYNNAKNLAEELKITYDLTLRRCKEKIQKSLFIVSDFIQYINHCCYGIGFHMIFSILYFNKNKPIEEIILLSPYKFVELYESIMLKNEQVPVISMDKEGIFSYKLAMKDWKKLIRN